MKKLLLLLCLGCISWCSSLNAQNKLKQDSTKSIQEAIPIITISDSAFGSGHNEGISGLLSASGDVFARSTDYNLSAAFFNIRGYDSENVILHLNGVPTNSLESGFSSFSSWGGLNQATRIEQNSFGMEASDFSFGGIGGAANIDTRAASQGKQIKVNLVSNNRSNYNNRLMFSGATGMMANGWAFSVAGSRRWAQEGYVPGTFYDAYSYFFSIDRKLNRQHSLNFTFLGARINRGRDRNAVQEIRDIAETNYYNPAWGFQNGEKRNARIARQHQPYAILRHDWVKDETFSISTSVSFQDGRNGNTALDWQDAADPRPDYYRKLPSAISDEDTRLEVELLLSQEESLRQIRWDQLFDANRSGIETIENVGGVDGNDATGLRSRYIVGERRFDSQKVNFSTLLEKIISNELTVQGGVTVQRFEGDNYQVVEDLLGGDYYYNINQFAERDFGSNAQEIQFDLDSPDRVIREGERYGYHYRSNINKNDAWIQAQLNFGRLKAHAALSGQQTTFWRTGLNRNGLFPENSFGESLQNRFNNFGVKGGMSYALSGRHFIKANAGHQTRAPFFRDVYLSARTRNDVVPNLQSEEIISIDAAYLYNSPNLKGKLGIYLSEFNDQTEVRSFYHDELRTFVNFAMTDIDTRHVGLEFALEGKIVSGLTFETVLSLGQFLYNSRPLATISADNNAEIVAEEQVYINHFFVPNIPQTAAVLGLEYQTPGTSNVTFGITGVYFDNIWASLNPDRRVLSAINATRDFPTFFEPDSPEGQAILTQEKSPASFLLNIGVRREFKLNEDWKLNAQLDVNNILNNQEFIISNDEQLRFNKEDKDITTFPNRYRYARGITYFLNLTATLSF